MKKASIAQMAPGFALTTPGLTATMEAAGLYDAAARRSTPEGHVAAGAHYVEHHDDDGGFSRFVSWDVAAVARCIPQIAPALGRPRLVFRNRTMAAEALQRAAAGLRDMMPAEDRHLVDPVAEGGVRRMLAEAHGAKDRAEAARTLLASGVEELRRRFEGSIDPVAVHRLEAVEGVMRWLETTDRPVPPSVVRARVEFDRPPERRVTLDEEAATMALSVQEWLLLDTGYVVNGGRDTAMDRRLAEAVLEPLSRGLQPYLRDRWPEIGMPAHVTRRSGTRLLLTLRSGSAHGTIVASAHPVNHLSGRLVVALAPVAHLLAHLGAREATVSSGDAQVVRRLLELASGYREGTTAR